MNPAATCTFNPLFTPSESNIIFIRVQTLAVFTSAVAGSLGAEYAVEMDAVAPLSAIASMSALVVESPFRKEREGHLSRKHRSHSSDIFTRRPFS
jgi:hypothetical protein